jgi:hypothetical protein
MMTRMDHQIRRQILTKIRVRIAAEQNHARKAYLLGLEAGELMKGAQEASGAEREELQRNFEQAKKLGIKPDLNQ